LFSEFPTPPAFACHGEASHPLITDSSITVYDRCGGVGRGLGVGRVLGVGLGLGVEVGVGLGVAVAVGVGVAVAVAVAVGVGVGVPPPPGAWIPTVIGVPVLKKPTVALALCGG
jgi:hypothetical protein